MRKITPAQRHRFDQLLEKILDGLPPRLFELLDQVPLIVEDEPSASLLDQLELDPRDGDLCGLHWGTPLTERSYEDSWRPPDSIMLFRGPIVRLTHAGTTDNAPAGSKSGSLRNLERQIHITLLHEIGHHFGLEEEDLDELGYG